MRLSYDQAGNGAVIAVSVAAYPEVARVDFPDPAGWTFTALQAAAAASPGRFKIVGAAGSRQLLDNGVVLASEESEGQAGTSVQTLNAGLLGWAYAQSFQLVSATRDANGAITTASIVWPDASTGTFTTDTASSAFPGAIDAYHITYVPASGPTKTVTQTAVTRDPITGAVTAQPALTVT